MATVVDSIIDRSFQIGNESIESLYLTTIRKPFSDELELKNINNQLDNLFRYVIDNINPKTFHKTITHHYLVNILFRVIPELVNKRKIIMNIDSKYSDYQDNNKNSNKFYKTLPFDYYGYKTNINEDYVLYSKIFWYRCVKNLHCLNINNKKFDRSYFKYKDNEGQENIKNNIEIFKLSLFFGDITKKMKRHIIFNIIPELITKL